MQNYLILAHPEAKLPRIEPVEEITPGDQEEDSFSQYYSADLPRNKEKKPAAVKLKGEKVVHEEMHILEAELPVKSSTPKPGQEVSPSRSISRRFCSARFTKRSEK